MKINGFYNTKTNEVIKFLNPLLPFYPMVDMKIYVRIYRVQGEVLVAACDEELLGKTFREGELKLEVKERFYKGELREVEELESLLEKATIANLTGERCVRKAIELGYVDEKRVLYVQSIPHAQMAKLL